MNSIPRIRLTSGDIPVNRACSSQFGRLDGSGSRNMNRTRTPRRIASSISLLNSVIVAPPVTASRSNVRFAPASVPFRSDSLAKTFLSGKTRAMLKELVVAWLNRIGSLLWRTSNSSSLWSRRFEDRNRTPSDRSNAAASQSPIFRAPALPIFLEARSAHPLPSNAAPTAARLSRMSVAKRIVSIICLEVPGSTRTPQMGGSSRRPSGVLIRGQCFSIASELKNSGASSYMQYVLS